MANDKSPFDEDIKAAVKELAATLDTIPLTVPFMSVKLKPEEKLAKYNEMRDDGAAWGEMLATRSWPEVFKYAGEMEKLRKGAEEVTP